MLAIILIIIGVSLRLIPHIPNFAPITALALFGGANLNKKYALIVPLLAMLISDFFLGFHSTMLYVYVSFLISGLIGLWLKSRKTPLYIFGATTAASLQFFLITNFGVWAEGMYSRGFEGLITSYIMGVPFYRYTVLGDLFYTGVLFLSYQLILGLGKRFKLARVK